jgi:stage V sporulation protein SpoVS
MDIIKVAGTSRSTAVAGAIAGVMREREHVIMCIPSFVEVMIDDQERTAVRMRIERREKPKSSPPTECTSPETA